MVIDNLWENLSPDTDRINKIRKDLEIGIAPHLPFFIVGLNEEKELLKKRISEIDSHMSICLLKSQYGNGKTNMLKYLENFFIKNNQYRIHAQTWRADIDKFNINQFLLYIIHNSFFHKLMDFLQISTYNDLKTASQNFEGSMSVLQNYVNVIIENQTNEERIIELIQLGTGFKTDKNSFKKYNLEKFNDYNRLDVLKFFLNVFAANRYYILFCIDELEKIMEKSRARFQTFLTSYRELIDESSNIRGHMLITAMTDALGSSDVSLESYNPAFERRIKNCTITLPSLNKKEDLKEIAKSLNNLMDKRLIDSEIDDIVNGVLKNRWAHTNEIVVDIYNRMNLGHKSWKEYIKEGSLEEILQKKIDELVEEDVMIRINSKFFSPVEEYMQIFGEKGVTYTIKAQMYQTIRKIEENKSYVFLFTSELESNINRILNVRQLFPLDSIIIFSPKELGLSNNDLEDAGLSEKCTIVTYEPIEMMALIELFLEDYENNYLREAINSYTKGL